jgi:hypothetical protein
MRKRAERERHRRARNTIVLELGDIFFLIRPRVDEDRRNGLSPKAGLLNRNIMHRSSSDECRQAGYTATAA